MVSSRLVSKLNLVTRSHPTPYQLQWLSEEGKIFINEQVEVPFSIGKYEDVVLCDVAPMETSHILLGRPWQYDKRTIHDCFLNKFTFLHQDRKVVLSPMTPEQVAADKQRLREKLEEERKERENEDNKGDNECEIKSETKFEEKKIEESSEKKKEINKNDGESKKNFFYTKR